MFQFHQHSGKISLVLKRVEDRNINPRSTILFDHLFIYHKPADYLYSVFELTKEQLYPYTDRNLAKV